MTRCARAVLAKRHSISLASGALGERPKGRQNSQSSPNVDFIEDATGSVKFQTVRVTGITVDWTPLAVTVTVPV